MNNLKHCVLPGGYIDESGAVHRDVVLATLSGREEELLVSTAFEPDDRDAGAVSAHLVTEVLSRCVRSIGPVTPVTPTIARSLLVADRQFLMLRLRVLTFGDRVRANLHCPWPDCGSKIDIDFSILDIPVRELVNRIRIHRMRLSEGATIRDEQGDSHADITFRLPCGADQEQLSGYLNSAPAHTLKLLLDRCLLSIGANCPPTSALVESLSPLARLEIEREMQRIAPSVELTMAGNCPDCQREFSTPFDLEAFFFGEIRTSRAMLYREIHYLAYHYHWSEADILAMSQEKRRYYIETLAEEMDRLNRAHA